MLPNIEPPDQRLFVYKELLLKWQKSINLISPQTIDDIENRHFVDSQQIIEYIPNSVKTCSDIGSGAGFPGLVCAILRPDIHFHLIESDARKCAFLQTVSRETNCSNVTIHTKRLEDCLGEISPDLITSRALAPMQKLVGWWQDFAPKSDCLFLKGENWQAELNDAQEKYSFDYQDFQSQTHSKSRILLLTNLT